SHHNVGTVAYAQGNACPLDALICRLRARGELPGMCGGYSGAEQDAVLAAQWAKTWRDLQAEAIDIANRMKDPQAKLVMLQVPRSYGRLVDRAELGIEV